MNDEEGQSYVQIDEKLRLSMTLTGWQLQKKRETKKGIKWHSYRYYSSLESALRDLMYIKLSQELFTDTKTMMEANQKVIRQISSVFKPIISFHEEGKS